MQHALVPVCTDLPDRTQARSAAGRCGAVEISVPVHERGSQDVATVGRSAGKTVQYGQGSRLPAECVQNSAIGRAAFFRHAVKVSGRIFQQAGIGGIFPVVRRTGESVEDAVFPLRIYLEQHAGVGCSTLRGGAIEITRLVLQQSSRRRRAVRSSDKVVQHGFGAGGIDPEHHSRIRTASHGRRTVEIARRVAHQRGKRLSPVGAAAEAVQRGFRPVGR